VVFERHDLHNFASINHNFMPYPSRDSRPAEVAPQPTKAEEIKPVENKSMKVAELMAQFLRPSASSDEETLRMVAQYSLQISPRQQMTINRLQMLAMDPKVPLFERERILTFIRSWQETKRYHDTMPFIGRTVDALSLRRFWSQDSMKGSVIKQDK